MKSQFESADELDGFDDLKDEDKERLRKAWEEGKVADEDIPETARKAPGEEAEEDEEKPKKRAPAKAKKDAGGEDGEKPKRKRAPAKAKKVEDEGDEDAEDKPKKVPARKPRVKVQYFRTLHIFVLTVFHRKLQLHQMLKIRESLRRNPRSVHLQESLLPRRKWLRRRPQQGSELLRRKYV
jgi:hypothetical protein